MSREKLYRNDGFEEQAFVRPDTGETVIVLPGETLYKSGASSRETGREQVIRAGERERLTGGYDKRMKQAKEAFDMLKDNRSAHAAMDYLSLHIQSGTNLIVDDAGNRYTVSQLGKDMGVSRQTASSYIAVLKEKNIVREVYLNSGTYLCMNPNYFSNGESVSTYIMSLFAEK